MAEAQLRAGQQQALRAEQFAKQSIVLALAIGRVADDRVRCVGQVTTQLVAPDHQGQLQGATNSVNSIAQMAGPFLFTLTFAYFISDSTPVKLPGAPFLLASELLLLSLVIAWRTLGGVKNS